MRRLHASDIAMPEGAAGPAAIGRVRQPDPTFLWVSGWLGDAGRLAVMLATALVRFRFPGQKSSIRRPEMTRLSDAAGATEREPQRRARRFNVCRRPSRSRPLDATRAKNVRIGGSLYRRI